MIPAPIRVIGVGSPFGDDRLGWTAARMLEQELHASIARGDIEVRLLDRPGSLLIAALEGADRVILIDAVHSGAPEGTVHVLDTKAIVGQNGPLSSHQIGVAEALRLARALDVLPRQLAILGLEAEPATDGGEHSEAIALGLGRLTQAVREQIGRWQ